MKNNRTMNKCKRHLCLFILCLTSLGAFSQASDKVDADKLLFEALRQATVSENYHEPLIISSDRLTETSEKGIYLMKGNSFQVSSLNSDIYVCKGDNGQWIPINSKRYPLETAVNMLQNRPTDNGHSITITHHQYGGKKPRATIPMQCLFDMFARSMKIYSTVTRINEKELEALLVFHHPQRNFIHMLQMKISTPQLMDKSYTIEADLYSNIPQDNVKSIFNNKTKTTYK